MTMLETIKGRQNFISGFTIFIQQKLCSVLDEFSYQNSTNQTNGSL